MFNIQDFKNASLIGYKLTLLIDDTNEDNTFGFTESVEKVTYNLKKINETFKYKDIDNRLENSETGLTTLFPVGRYIAIVELKKDKSKIKRNNAKSMFIQRNYLYTAKDLEYPW